MTRGLALFLGAFTLLNLAGDSRFDVNLWWIDLWPLPRVVAIVTLIAFAVAMLALAFGKRNAITTGLTIAMLIFAVANTIRFYVVLARGEIHSRFPIPLSLLIAVALAAILWGGFSNPPAPRQTTTPSTRFPASPSPARNASSPARARRSSTASAIRTPT